MLKAVRLISPRFVNKAFVGEGARLYGGRWNSKGTPIVYTSSSLALAALEMLVHLGSTDLLEGPFVYITASVDEKDITEPDPAALSENWKDDERITKKIGDDWVNGGASLVFKVPSVVIPEEPNYLINPKHPDADTLTLSDPKPFEFDPRLG